TGRGRAVPWGRAIEAATRAPAIASCDSEGARPDAAVQPGRGNGRWGLLNAYPAVGLDGRVGEVAVDVPVGDVRVDLGVLDRGDPLDHLPGDGGVVVERVLVDVDRQLRALEVRAREDLRLPAAVPRDGLTDRLRVGELVPRHDVGHGPGGDGVLEVVADLAVQDARVGARDAGVRHLALDERVRLVPGGEVVGRVVEPAHAVVAPLPGAEHVALGLVERHEHDVVLVLLGQLEHLVDLRADLVEV